MQSRRSDLRRSGLEEQFEGVNEMFFSLEKLYKAKVMPRYTMGRWTCQHWSTQ